MTIWVCQNDRSIVSDPYIVSRNLNELKMCLGDVEEPKPLKCTVSVDLVAHQDFCQLGLSLVANFVSALID